MKMPMLAALLVIIVIASPVFPLANLFISLFPSIPSWDEIACLLDVAVEISAVVTRVVLSTVEGQYLPRLLVRVDVV